MARIVFDLDGTLVHPTPTRTAPGIEGPPEPLAALPCGTFAELPGRIDGLLEARAAA
jgi:hypothetical protein